MTQRTLLLLGTKKGTFIVDSKDRRTWDVRGPFCEAWPISHVNFDPASGAILAGGGNEWFGPAVWRSTDFGETWTHSSEGLTYGEEGPAIRTVWHVRPANGVIYAGVEPAGLFRSDDGGVTWSHVSGLREHPSTPDWMPGGGGLCLHSIVPHDSDPRQMWVAISAVGTFYTADGGATWTHRNKGVRNDYFPEPGAEYGYCVHKLLAAAGQPEKLFQQNHCGVYRSRDAGATWEEITAGLPSQFGFPLALHPRDPETLWTLPLNGDQAGRFFPDGQPAIWRSRDSGDTWQRFAGGLPGSNAFTNVLRDGMSNDGLDPVGVYFGTSTGQLYASSDEGENWTEICGTLPAIWSVEAVAVED